MNKQLLKALEAEGDEENYRNESSKSFNIRKREMLKKDQRKKANVISNNMRHERNLSV